MWGCAGSDSASKPAPGSSRRERQEPRLRQGVLAGSVHRMTHLKVEGSRKHWSSPVFSLHAFYAMPVFMARLTSAATGLCPICTAALRVEYKAKYEMTE